MWRASSQRPAPSAQRPTPNAHRQHLCDHTRVQSPFERDVTVYWPDADAAGIVWFGNFFRYLEETEEELFRARGHERQVLLQRLKVFMPRTHMDIGFRSPAKVNDRLVVAMLPERKSDRRLAWNFRISHRSTGATVCEGAYRTACVDAESFVARPFPSEVLSILAV